MRTLATLVVSLALAAAVAPSPARAQSVVLGPWAGGPSRA